MKQRRVIGFWVQSFFSDLFILHASIELIKQNVPNLHSQLFGLLNVLIIFQITRSHQIFNWCPLKSFLDLVNCWIATMSCILFFVVFLPHGTDPWVIHFFQSSLLFITGFSLILTVLQIFFEKFHKKLATLISLDLSLNYLKLILWFVLIIIYFSIHINNAATAQRKNQLIRLFSLLFHIFNEFHAEMDGNLIKNVELLTHLCSPFSHIIKPSIRNNILWIFNFNTRQIRNDHCILNLGWLLFQLGLNCQSRLCTQLP